MHECMWRGGLVSTRSSVHLQLSQPYWILAQGGQQLQRLEDKGSVAREAGQIAQPDWKHACFDQGRDFVRTGLSNLLKRSCSLALDANVISVCVHHLNNCPNPIILDQLSSAFWGLGDGLGGGQCVNVWIPACGVWQNQCVRCCKVRCISSTKVGGLHVLACMNCALD